VEYGFTRLFPGPFNGLATNGDSVSFGAATSFDVQSVVGRVSYKVPDADILMASSPERRRLAAVGAEADL
jgi:hypothetical protein